MKKQVTIEIDACGVCETEVGESSYHDRFCSLCKELFCGKHVQCLNARTESDIAEFHGIEVCDLCWSKSGDLVTQACQLAEKQKEVHTELASFMSTWNA